MLEKPIATVLAVVLSLGLVSAYPYAYAQSNNTQQQTEIAALPVVNGTVLAVGNVTVANDTGIGQTTSTATQNHSQAFQALQNSTAILNQQLDREDTNQTDRAEIKRTISQGMSALGDAADKVVNATSEQLRTVQTNAEAISEAVDQLFGE